MTCQSLLSLPVAGNDDDEARLPRLQAKVSSFGRPEGRQAQHDRELHNAVPLMTVGILEGS